MSAALNLPMIWGASSPQATPTGSFLAEDETLGAELSSSQMEEASESVPRVSLAFYRRHTESMLRRYLYISMQVGRTPSILGDSVQRGWSSNRPVRTFEDAVIFVLDMERCLDKLGGLDRQMLSRIVLQEYTQAEAASLIGMSIRAIGYKFPLALDRLTEELLESGLLALPHS